MSISRRRPGPSVTRTVATVTVLLVLLVWMLSGGASDALLALAEAISEPLAAEIERLVAT